MKKPKEWYSASRRLLSHPVKSFRAVEGLDKRLFKTAKRGGPEVGYKKGDITKRSCSAKVVMMM